MSEKPTPNQVARALLASADKMGGPRTEAEDLAQAFLDAAEAWRNFDQQELDRILLTGEPDDA